MAYDTSKLLSMSQDELDDLFRNSPAGDIPDGEAKGTAIVDPGTVLSDAVANVVKIFAWQGKVFDSQNGVLKNRVSPFGVDAIQATVYKGESWFDGNECIVLDYSKTSIVAHWIRDEIRLIAPGVYLGLVYWGKSRLIFFSLEF
ncbi:hypothetical protein LMG28688_06938 [Paraburkholderia caffeinitolerans]|uniref:Uncharacterized protein n=1 Tax=Paraburkholderia caffeinitolerans TaxID=1723730 RepID=A0A6J5GZP1_9BURK|nr:hypothetical protein [Paraburkholderia caffeinitolerans]CAB3809193.1 hypothetical protein LMG28688_06938 [Paraburkholderia caffeinitolerans]